jgi:hypothetical protein
MAPKRRSADYLPHQIAAKASDLPKIVGHELREHYELPHDLPHGMFTLLIELKTLDQIPALGTRLARKQHPNSPQLTKSGPTSASTR